MPWPSDEPSAPAWSPETWQDDDALAADLAAAVADDDLRRRVERAASSAFHAHRGMLALRDELAVDLLLLELVHDSSTADGPVAVRDRSGQPSRTLVFEGDGVGVEVEVGDSGVEGQLIPARRGRVVLRTPDRDVAEVTTDEVGYFRLGITPEGPVRLVCETPDGTCVTPWLPW
ncbi:MAG: hypothetical protein J7503_11465 [Cellulomonas iranensis]|uniref:hypothetical protein n=1 Tax=Cellulomonas iranensis TaxID=76862 RepID=UPI001B15511D|nr:hypothetical protein [Cellulomonas iranensis]MBO9569428.1 hypothetical protein [Cellulomonas iranensis]UCN15613.1 hypothetical protein LFM56_04655 [Cellulomonas iranensis]